MRNGRVGNNAKLHVNSFGISQFRVPHQTTNHTVFYVHCVRVVSRNAFVLSFLTKGAPRQPNPTIRQLRLIFHFAPFSIYITPTPALYFPFLSFPFLFLLPLLLHERLLLFFLVLLLSLFRRREILSL
ncbi:uncharacterized protein LOC111308533 isoform X3 [Durio zibethinus]|uniref:Uncharacterized protein LOC111308533 isoform X3 n=1 Tax=Durio zibethinus TaxID=66656 RepID=A0A6P6ACR1_DURZI|nr:uncharacterized protein LOC111308533 isoform X3 [Durio zibethinus]